MCQRRYNYVKYFRCLLIQPNTRELRCELIFFSLSRVLFFRRIFCGFCTTFGWIVYVFWFVYLHILRWFRMHCKFNNSGKLREKKMIKFNALYVIFLMDFLDGRKTSQDLRLKLNVCCVCLFSSLVEHLLFLFHFISKSMRYYLRIRNACVALFLPQLRVCHWTAHR